MKRNTGFTLIEILIAIVIVAILASVAIPAYSDYVIRGTIPDATTALAKAKIKFESYYDDHITYVGGPCPTNTKNFTFTCGPTTDPNDSSKVLDPDSHFTLTATGVGRMTGFVYTIDENLSMTSKTPNWGVSNDCWINNSGGRCGM